MPEVNAQSDQNVKNEIEKNFKTKIIKETPK